MLEHVWQGEWIDDHEVQRRLPDLDLTVRSVLREPLRVQVVLDACERLSVALGDSDSAQYRRLLSCLGQSAGAAGTISELAAFLSRESLHRKVVRELGDADPGRLARRDFRETVYEAWAPVGVVVHVAPTNAAAVGALSAVEGLLAGNVNIVKTGGADTLFTHQVLAELAALDTTGTVTPRIIVLRFPSSRTDWLADICACADAVAVWGGEQALAGVADLVPAGCRLVEWGPKISFGYLTADTWSADDVLTALADQVCELEQQACSSPQVIYLDTDDTATVFDFGERFAAVLGEVSARLPRPAVPPAEQAEITNTVLVAQHEEHLGLTAVCGAAGDGWRVLADTRAALRASPLHRTVWVKPLPRQQILATLRPMRRYLQTVGLAANVPDTAELTRAFFTAGVLRVTPPGDMLGSYTGEPHDGVYALQRYSRRVSARLDEAFAGIASLDELIDEPRTTTVTGPVMTKADFQHLTVPARHAEMFFRSGGSSGDPKLSVFTYDDYSVQMRHTAEGFLAAGFDPRTDRAMNLFFGGGLYGGFLSFYSVLEHLRAVQYPMGAHPDYAMVAQTIADQGVNTLLGMPSYLTRVFDEGADVLRRYGGVRKVFFGGEHLPRRQRQRLADEFGVEVIRSAAYGSVDAGPLGYQCGHAEGTVHHLFTGLHDLEILAVNEDRPAATGETGRLVFSPRVRTGVSLRRYEIGDLGRWVPGACACGRRCPRFELLGRFGDVFRVASIFLNYRKLRAILEDELDYSGDFQIVLTTADSGTEQLTVRVAAAHHLSSDKIIHVLVTNDDELREVVEVDRLLTLAVEHCRPGSFDRTPGSGKLKAVLDRRDPVR